MKKSSVPIIHLEPAEFQIAVKWCLGIAVTDSPVCSTCKHGGDVVSRHNRLRDVLLESCRRACFGPGPQVEAGSGLGHEGHRTWPADISPIGDIICFLHTNMQCLQVAAVGFGCC